MKKTAIYILLVMSMLLAACTNSSTATSTPANTEEASAPNVTVPTAPTTGLVSDCTVIAQEPTPGPTAQSLFPPVAANDWVKGPEDARVTIMEYGDFQ